MSLDKCRVIALTLQYTYELHLQLIHL